jgi:hypothetical protein
LVYLVGCSVDRAGAGAGAYNWKGVNTAGRRDKLRSPHGATTFQPTIDSTSLELPDLQERWFTTFLQPIPRAELEVEDTRAEASRQPNRGDSIDSQKTCRVPATCATPPNTISSPTKRLSLHNVVLAWHTVRHLLLCHPLPLHGIQS